jgi:hypothetical protein
VLVARVRAAAVGVLIRGAGARVRSRPGLFGIRAGTRGGIAARLGLGFAARAVRVRRRARAAVALRCRGAKTGARGWQVTRGSGAAAGEEKGEKRGRRLWVLSRSGDAAEASEREKTGVAGVGRKGKADGWGPPVSCPGRKEGRGRDASR